MPSFSYLCAGAVVASYETNIRRLAESPYAGVISAVAAVCLAVLLSFETVPAPVRSTVFYLQVALENIFLPVCIAWIVGSSVFQSNYLTRFLTTPPILFLGMISYSLYLWQEMFTAGRDMYLSYSVLLFSPLMFVVATLSYYFIERPCVTLGKRFLAVSSDGIGVAPGSPT
jgi:peptidoglycan/LPS O-acetylase OafA/YrhL